MKNLKLHLQLNSDLDLVAKENSTQRILEIVVIPPEKTSRNHRLSLNLALVLDRSGSMAGQKLNYIKQAANHMLDLLEGQDRVALITYDDKVRVDVPSTNVTEQNRPILQEQISLLRTGGMTNLEGGWLAGCEEIAKNAQDDMVNRALLLTDGLANVGESDLEVLAVHAKELARRGISTSTFGVGENFNEHLLEGMAVQGDGNYYFINTPERAHEYFLHEFSQLDKLTGRDVEIILDIPRSIQWEILGGRKYWVDHERLHIGLGSLYANVKQEIYLSLDIPADLDSKEVKIVARVLGKGIEDQLYEDEQEKNYTYTSLAEMKSAGRDKGVMERFALVKLSDIANQALKLERIMKNEAAYKLLAQAIEDYHNFLSPDKLDIYVQLSERIKRGMEEFDRKSSQYDMYTVRQSRLNQPK